MGFFDVVGNAAKLHAVGSRMIDHITGAGIVVARLPDATDADGVAAIGIQGYGIFAGGVAGELFALLLPDGRDVRVSVEADAGGLLLEVISR